MKKIGIFCFASKQNGGVYQYTQAMVDALLLDKTYEYLLITTENNQDYDNKAAELLKLNKNFDSLFTKVAILSASAGRIGKLIFKSERRMLKDVDLFLSPAICLYPHYWLDKPYVITIHDLQEKHFPKFFTVPQRIKRAIITTRAARRSCHIICESGYVKNDVIKYTGVSHNKISVVRAPPPMVTCKLDYSKGYLQRVKNRYSLPEKYLFYPAQFWHHKNHEKLLDAFSLIAARYPDMNLVFSGGEPNARRQVLKKNNSKNIIRKIQELNLVEKVRLIGYVDYSDLAAIYLLSEMLVVPTLFESISLPIYEAFWLNIPVCASAVVALPEQVGDAGLIFDPKDPQDIAEKVTEMLENESLRNRCIENGKKKIQQLSLINYSKSLIELINRALVK